MLQTSPRFEVEFEMNLNLSMKFFKKPFWQPQLPVARSSTKKNISRVIFVILANKYGTTYLPELLPSNGGFLGLATLATSGTWQPTGGI